MRALGVPKPPAELAIARKRMTRAVAVITSTPGLGLTPEDGVAMMKDADPVFQDPAKWNDIVRLQHEAENEVRTFVMPIYPSSEQIDQGLVILRKFMLRALVEVAGLMPAFCYFSVGFAIDKMRSDPDIRAALPTLYNRLRLELLGIETAWTPPRPRP